MPAMQSDAEQPVRVISAVEPDQRRSAPAASERALHTSIKISPLSLPAHNRILSPAAVSASLEETTQDGSQCVAHSSDAACRAKPGFESAVCGSFASIQALPVAGSVASTVRCMPPLKASMSSSTAALLKRQAAAIEPSDHEQWHTLDNSTAALEASFARAEARTAQMEKEACTWSDDEPTPREKDHEPEIPFQEGAPQLQSLKRSLHTGITPLQPLSQSLQQPLLHLKTHNQKHGSFKSKHARWHDASAKMERRKSAPPHAARRLPSRHHNLPASYYSSAAWYRPPNVPPGSVKVTTPLGEVAESSHPLRELVAGCADEGIASPRIIRQIGSGVPDAASDQSETAAPFSVNHFILPPPVQQQQEQQQQQPRTCSSQEPAFPRDGRAYQLGVLSQGSSEADEADARAADVIEATAIAAGLLRAPAASHTDRGAQEHDGHQQVPGSAREAKQWSHLRATASVSVRRRRTCSTAPPLLSWTDGFNHACGAAQGLATQPHMIDPASRTQDTSAFTPLLQSGNFKTNDAVSDSRPQADTRGIAEGGTVPHTLQPPLHRLLAAWENPVR